MTLSLEETKKQLIEEGKKQSRTGRRLPELLSWRYPPLGTAMPLLKRLPLKAVWFLASDVSECPSIGIPSPLRAG